MEEGVYDSITLNKMYHSANWNEQNLNMVIPKILYIFKHYVVQNVQLADKNI
jgi:hypothetical protein